MNKVIVTGASGFIGSSIVKTLLERNVEVIAIDRTFDNVSFSTLNNIRKIELDLNDIDKLKKAIPEGKYDAFYHFAWAGVNGPEKANPIAQLKNAEQTISCATVASLLNCKKFLCAGTVAEYATNSLPSLKKTNGGMMYGVVKQSTHLILEAFCKNIGLDFIWMQFSNIYGPNNKTGNLISYTIDQLNNNKEATFGPALQPYDFIYIDDLIDAVIKLGECDTKYNTYFIGSGSPRLLKDYLLEIGKLAGKESLIKIGVRDDDGIRYTFDMFDTSRLIEDIGNFVSTSFFEGIQYTINGHSN